jgi:hypothetical protein
MRRRRFLTVITLISLALAVFFAAAWMRGRWNWRCEGVIVRTAAQTVWLSSIPFGWTATRVSTASSLDSPTGVSTVSFRSSATDTDTLCEYYQSRGGYGVAGVWWLSAPERAADGERWRRELHVPHGLATASAVLVPIVIVIPWWRGRWRVRNGCCVACR